MKKTIQKITGLIALSVGLASQVPVFAAADQVGQKQSGIHEDFPWRIGVKLWHKHPIKTVMDRLSGGLEFALGPFIEWKPFDSLGIQTGVLYSYNDLATAGFNWQMRVVSGWSGKPKKSIKNASNTIDIDRVKFDAISIPLSIRFYPGSGQQLALYIGTRLLIPVLKAKQICYGFISCNNGHKAKLFEWINQEMEFFKDKSSKQLAHDLEIKSHVTWDLGFDYSTKFGLIVGMNGFGLMLGYDCTRHWLK
ncbi:hypothetical protein [Cardinium endosymbiont of Philonthus spinipes]|uniref:hypothetical protein n=1 Tax=Cardinium endosymbiont of Philonthus spinipes TaxID=3077941 RepID=UPI00313A9C01